MNTITDELRKEAREYGFTEFTRPMEILHGLPEKTILEIRNHIFRVSMDSYIAGAFRQETKLTYSNPRITTSQPFEKSVSVGGGMFLP